MCNMCSDLIRSCDNCGYTTEISVDDIIVIISELTKSERERLLNELKLKGIL